MNQETMTKIDVTQEICPVNEFISIQDQQVCTSFSHQSEPEHDLQCLTYTYHPETQSKVYHNKCIPKQNIESYAIDKIAPTNQIIDEQALETNMDESVESFDGNSITTHVTKVNPKSTAKMIAEISTIDKYKPEYQPMHDQRVLQCEPEHLLEYTHHPNILKHNIKSYTNDIIAPKNQMIEEHSQQARSDESVESLIESLESQYEDCCPICRAQGSYKEIKQHLINCRLNMFKCEDCNKRFTTKWKFQIHLKTVHGEKFINFM